MHVTYRILFDISYLRTIVNRYFKQRPLFYKLPVQFSLALIPPVGIFIFAWQSGAEWRYLIFYILLFWVIFSILGVVFITWAIVRRFKKKAEFNEEIMVVLSDDGISASGPNVKSEWKWEAYPRSVRFADGILLLRLGAIRWLPDSALQEGMPDDATTLVESKSELKYV